MIRRLLALLRRDRAEPAPPRVIPPVWATDDELALLRKAGLL